MIIKFIYTLFLAILTALFVGLGIDAFYPGPKPPEFPDELKLVEFCQQKPESEIVKSEQEEYTRKQREFEKESKKYNRNVSIVSLIAAIITLIASLTALGKMKFIADGILLGGVFTAAYSVIRGLMSEDSAFRFIVVTIGLIIALILGYIKFIPKNRSRENKEISE